MTTQRTIEAWDTDLGPEALRRLSPADKARRVVASLTRKVCALERWAAEGRPGDGISEVPRDRAKLRRWRSSLEGLWPWADPAVDDPDGRNKELMDRFASALSVIERHQRRKARDPRRELDVARLRIAALEAQNLRLLDDNRRLRVDLASKGLVRT